MGGILALAFAVTTRVALPTRRNRQVTESRTPLDQNLPAPAETDIDLRLGAAAVASTVQVVDRVGYAGKRRRHRVEPVHSSMSLPRIT